MPPNAHLSAQNVNLLVTYLASLKSQDIPAPPPPPPAAVAGAPVDNAALIKYGEQLFNAQGCVQCHTIQGRLSNKTGPDLILAIKKDMPTKDWLKTQLVTPQAHNPLSIMPSFASRLNDEQMNAMIVFLSSLSTREATPLPAGATEEAPSQGSAPASSGGGVQAIGIIGDKEHGAILFHQSCIMCHGPHGNNKTPGYTAYLNGNQSNGTQAPKGVPSLNPIDRDVYNMDPQLFAQRIDQFIQHGIPNTEGGPNMPAFGDSHALTQAQIADLEAYVLSLNGVDRTMITNPGIEPKEFFYLLVAITSVIIMLAALYWFLMKLLKI